MRIIVIGAGLFGCSIAIKLASAGLDVKLIDKEGDIMQRASKCNHNRLHLGFHYPRSVKTAVQASDGLLSFILDYKDAVVSEFPNYYTVSKEGSKVSGDQFEDFCKEVGLFYTDELPPSNLINEKYVERSFKVNEPIFDYEILRRLVLERVQALKNIDLELNTTFQPQMIDDYDYVINASYEGFNVIHNLFGVDPIPLKMQDVVIPILKLEMDRIGLTIMDGPFGSIMPKGFEKNMFLLYDVVESVLEQSLTEDLSGDSNVDFDKFIAKSQSMYPFLERSNIVDSWRTIRALPINRNDARVSEIFLFENEPKLISILSGKIATCNKLALEILLYLKSGELRNNIKN